MATCDTRRGADISTNSLKVFYIFDNGDSVDHAEFIDITPNSYGK